jgi:hypothetical protein
MPAIIPLGHKLPCGSSNLPEDMSDRHCLRTPLFGLAPDRVYLADVLPSSLVSSYLTLSALLTVNPQFSGLLSVALAVGLPRLVVNQYRVLWSPDFPLLCLINCLINKAAIA